LVLGVNRVRRRARQGRPRRDPPDDPSEFLPIGDERVHMLQRGVGRITGRPVTAGNTVQIYSGGDEAYPPMLQAIAAARRSVGLSSYIFRDDTWGGRFIAALVEAQRRGVAVRVVIDGIGGGWLLSRTYHRLRREGVPAARFFHSLLPWRMPFLNLRTHKKILVVDGSVGFTGGMNIADENVMSTQPKRPVLDTHFRVEGQVVGQLTQAFLRDWAFTTGEEIDDAAWHTDSAVGPGAPARVINSGPDEDIEKVEFAVLEAVACAQSSIVLMTPYFLPDERLVTALALAAMRGVALDVVIPERSNKIVVDWATRANVGPLLSSGVRIWRSPLPFRHSKLMTVDGEWCLIGSSNWDIRSFRLNFELCIELYDRSLAASLSAMMERCHGRPLTRADLDGRSIAVRLRDAAARLLLPYL
jgi:cardiolipin synthase